MVLFYRVTQVGQLAFKISPKKPFSGLAYGGSRPENTANIVSITPKWVMETILCVAEESNKSGGRGKL